MFHRFALLSNTLCDRQARRRVLALLGALTLCACAALPSYQRPAAPIPAQWPGAEAMLDKKGTAPAQLTDWQAFFTDATLRELINTALANNRDLRVALLNIEQARAQLGLRRADQLPSLSTTVNAARTASSNTASNSAFSGGPTVTAYELDFFGRAASLKDQALAQYLATREASNTVQISLIASVVQSWLSLLADDELLALAQQTLATREASLSLLALKLRHGAASELDLRLAQTLRESARVTLAQLLRQRAADENALKLLLGQGLPALAVQQRASQPAPISTLAFAELPLGLPSELLAQRPDIRQAEALLIASHANLGAARAAFFPRISLSAGLGFASTELAGLFKSGSWSWSLAPQLLLPIFDGGRNQANLETALAARDILLAQYEKAIQSAFREVADLLAGRSALAQQLDAAQGLHQAESARAKLTKLRLDQGAASQLDWLEAQRALFAAQQGWLQTRLVYLQNQVGLYKALGGGAALAKPAP